MHCEKCGTKNEKDSKFCYKCGHKLETSNKVLSKFKNIPKQKKIIMVLVLIVVIISLIVLGILLNNPVKKVEDSLEHYYNNYQENDIKELITIGKILKNNKNDEKTLNNIKEATSKYLNNWVKNFNTEYSNRENLDNAYDKLTGALKDIYNYYNGLEYILTTKSYQKYTEEVNNLYRSKVNYFYGEDYEGNNDYQTYYYYQKVIKEDCYYNKVTKYIDNYISDELHKVLDEAKNKVKDQDATKNEDMLNALITELKYLKENKTSNNIDLSSNKEYQDLYNEVLEKIVSYMEKIINENPNNENNITKIDELLKLINDEKNTQYKKLLKLKEREEEKEPEKLAEKDPISYDSNVDATSKKREILNKTYESTIYFKTNTNKSKIIYDLNKEYKKFTTSIIPDLELNSNFKGNIIIYGDNKELYRKQEEKFKNIVDITKDYQIEIIELDITNIKELKIELEISNKSFDDNTNIYLVEPYLYK